VAKSASMHSALILLPLTLKLFLDLFVFWFQKLASQNSDLLGTYSSIPGNRNWQIETADWNLDVRLDI